MTHQIWHAFYFDGFLSSLPPVRTEVIEAESVDEAAEVAKTHLGKCKRVDIATPRWAGNSVRVILADDKATPPPAMH